MTVAANLAGHGCRLTVCAEEYEFPSISDGPDANWINGEVQLILGASGEFSATLSVCLRTEELASFAAQLRELHDAPEGEATLRHLESEVGATIRLEAGAGTMSVFVRAHTGALLSAEDLPTDRSFIRDAAAEFEQLSGAFPVRGEPYG
jgi:hypothetical protein